MFAFALLLVSPMVCVAQAAAADCATAGISVTSLHGPNFYVDLDETTPLTSAYTGYRIGNNGGAALPGIWVELANFSGGSVALSAGQETSQYVAPLAGGSSASRFFHLTASSVSGTAQGHDVRIWDNVPDAVGAVLLCSLGSGFSSVADTNDNHSNQVLSVATSASESQAIGTTFTVTVTGTTGHIGNGPSEDPGSFFMNPAAGSDWPAGAFRLVGTSLDLSVSGSFADTLRVTGIDGNDQTFTATYLFRVVGFSGSETSILPVQQIASGSRIRHTRISSVPASPSIPVMLGDLALSLSASPGVLEPGGGVSTFTATLSGTTGVTLDRFVATVPANTTYVPGSTTWGGNAVADPVVVGSSLEYTAAYPYTSENQPLVFQLEFSAAAGTFNTDVLGYIGSTRIDATVSVGSSAPPSVPVTVKDTQTITFAQPSDVLLSVGTRIVLGTTTSGLPVSYSSSTVGTCTVASNGTVTLLAPGSCTLTVSQSGGSVGGIVYNAAANVTRTFNITVEAANPGGGTGGAGGGTGGSTGGGTGGTEHTTPGSGNKTPTRPRTGAPLTGMRRETSGSLPGTFDLSYLPDGSLVVVAGDVAETRGVGTARMSGNTLILQQTKGFSGVIVIVVVVLRDGEARSLAITLVVNPAPVANAAFAVVNEVDAGGGAWSTSPRAEGYIRVTWDPSGNAVAYQLRSVTYPTLSMPDIGGVAATKVLLCATSKTSCEVRDLRGPGSSLELVAVGNDATISSSVVPTYTTDTLVPVLRLMFLPNSANLTAGSLRDLLQLAEVLRGEGFTSIHLDGHIASDRRKPTAFGKSLADARNRVVGDFLRRELGYAISVTCRNRLGARPAAPNTSERNRALNRRVELSLR